MWLTKHNGDLWRGSYGLEVAAVKDLKFRLGKQGGTRKGDNVATKYAIVINKCGKLLKKLRARL